MNIKKNYITTTIYIPILLLIIIFFSFTCRKDQINWMKIDPKFKMELDRNNYSSDSLITGIVQTKEQITNEQKEKLLKVGVQVLSVAGNIATIQFPLSSLPSLTNQDFILLILKPTTQKPISKP